MTSLSVDALAQIVAPLAERNKIVRVHLFGSRARGDNSDDSDYDFLILTTDDASLADVGQFRMELEEALGRPVDFAFERSARPAFMSMIKDEMRLVYG